MSDKLSISYHTAKRILLELLENNDFSTDEDILKILGSVVQKEIIFHLYIFILSTYPVNGTFVISNITIQTDGNIKYYFSHSLYHHC